MRLVFLTQVVDADHPALAQTNDAVAALARRCERVTVLCDRVGRHSLPANVELRTFAASSRIGRGLRLERGVGAAVLGGPRPDAVLAHMIPLFLILAAPVAKLRGVPLLLWYTHWHASRTLRVATALADAVLSVDRRSFPLESRKVRGIGHAIDTDAFRPLGGAPPGGPLRLVAVGRTARWKGYDTLLQGLRLALEGGLDATLELRGPQLTDDERAFRAELESIVAASPELRGRVSIAEPLARDLLPDLLAGADALVSPAQPRASQTLDKAVYEAAACGLPVLASNPALTEFLDGTGLRLGFRPRDPADLAAALMELAAASPEARATAGRLLRERVVQGHSVDSWAGAVVEIVRARPRPDVES